MTRAQFLLCISFKIGLREIYEQQAGEVVLFQWVEWLKDTLSLLPIHHSTHAEEGEGGEDDDEDEKERRAQEDALNEVALRQQLLLDFMKDIEVIHGDPYTERKVSMKKHCLCVYLDTHMPSSYT